MIGLYKWNQKLLFPNISATTRAATINSLLNITTTVLSSESALPHMLSVPTIYTTTCVTLPIDWQGYNVMKPICPITHTHIYSTRIYKHLIALTYVYMHACTQSLTHIQQSTHSLTHSLTRTLTHTHSLGHWHTLTLHLWEWTAHPQALESLHSLSPSQTAETAPFAAATVAVAVVDHHHWMFGCSKGSSRYCCVCQRGGQKVAGTCCCSVWGERVCTCADPPTAQPCCGSRRSGSLLSLTCASESLSEWVHKWEWTRVSEDEWANMSKYVSVSDCVGLCAKANEYH